MHPSLVRRAKHAVPLHAVTQKGLKAWAREAGKTRATLAFERGLLRPRAASSCPYPTPAAPCRPYVLGLGKGGDPLAARGLFGAARSRHLSPGRYAGGRGGGVLTLASILGPLQFRALQEERSRRAEARRARRHRWRRSHADRRRRVPRPRSHQYAGRTTWDRWNSQAAAQGLAKRHRAKITVMVGDALTKANYPLIPAVGRRRCVRRGSSN